MSRVSRQSGVRIWSVAEDSSLQVLLKEGLYDFQAVAAEVPMLRVFVDAEG